MAGSSKKPFTVPDPIGALQDAADAWQRRYNEAQAAADERKSRARQVERTADRAGNALDAAQAGAATHAALSGNAKAERFARRLVRRAGPVGHGITALEAGAGYVADRADGMPRDEAIVRRGSKVLLGVAGTGVGAVGGGAAGGVLGGPVGAFAGGVVGGAAGGAAAEDWSDEVGDAYVQMKRAAQRAALPYTDPLYVMRALRSR